MSQDPWQRRSGFSGEAIAVLLNEYALLSDCVCAPSTLLLLSTHLASTSPLFFETASLPWACLKLTMWLNVTWDYRCVPQSDFQIGF